MKPWMQELGLLLSDLLAYPEEQPRHGFRGIQAMGEELTARAGDMDLPARERAALQKAGAALYETAARHQKASLAELQVAHVELFDLRAECSLYLAWHKYGDSPMQGRALAGLSELYRDYGLELAGHELPDYLPLLLEFMSVAPPEALHVIMDGFGPQLQALAAKIGGSQGLYAHAGHCLSALADCLAPDGPAEAPSSSAPKARSKGEKPCMAG